MVSEIKMKNEKVRKRKGGKAIWGIVMIRLAVGQWGPGLLVAL